MKFKALISLLVLLTVFAVGCKKDEGANTETATVTDTGATVYSDTSATSTATSDTSATATGTMSTDTTPTVRSTGTDTTGTRSTTTT